VSLEQLFVDELKDLYDAEKQLVRALPKMSKAASDEELSELIQEHLEQTKGHVARLEQVFEMIEEKAKGKPCMGMKGLIEEGQEVAKEDFEEELLDTAIIGAARKVEHYEMTAYESVCSLARALGNGPAVQLLQQTFQEESTADKRLESVGKRLMEQIGPEEGNEMEESAEEGAEETQSRPRRATAGGRRRSSSARQTTQSRSRSQSRSPKGRPQSISSSRGNRSGGGSRSSSATTTDHDEIRRWAEERGAKPACVTGTGGRGDIGMIRLDFPGYSGGDSLQSISWDKWFEKFDGSNLALLYQKKTSGGQKSNFNKLVSRETGSRRAKKAA